MICVINSIFLEKIICLNNKCENNSTCSVRKNSYNCKCLNGFSGTHCENCKYQINKLLVKSNFRKN